MSARLTPDTLAHIRNNAGKVAPVKIAESLDWSLPQLERVARDRKIDLHLRVYGTQDPDHEPMSAHVAEHPTRRHFGPRRDGRTEQAMIRLFPSDARMIAAIGSAQGLRRGQTLCRIIENARDRGLIDELVRLPAPRPEGEGGDVG